MERGLRRDDEHRRRGTGFVELRDHIVEGSVGEDVGVVREKVLVAVEVLSYAAQSLTDRRFQTRIDERDGPLADVGIQKLDFVGMEDEVIGLRFAVVEEEVFDGLGAVPEAEDELLVAKVGVVVHHVPQQGPGADHLHRLGDGVVAVVTHAHAVTTAEQDNFHFVSLLATMSGWESALCRDGKTSTLSARDVARCGSVSAGCTIRVLEKEE